MILSTKSYEEFGILDNFHEFTITYPVKLKYEVGSEAAHCVFFWCNPNNHIFLIGQNVVQT